MVIRFILLGGLSIGLVGLFPWQTAGQEMDGRSGGQRVVWEYGPFGARVCLVIEEGETWQWAAFASAEVGITAGHPRVGLRGERLLAISPIGRFSVSLELGVSLSGFWPQFGFHWYPTEGVVISLDYDLLQSQPRLRIGYSPDSEEENAGGHEQ
jgi:hypothetical protein